MSTACSALCARCVRPSFIFVMRASGSCGCRQSLLRLSSGASNRAAPSRPASGWRGQTPARVGPETPDRSRPSLCRTILRQGRVRFKGPWHRSRWSYPSRDRWSQHVQDPGEHRPVRRQIDQAPRRRDRRVLGRRLLEAQPPGSPAVPANPRCARQSRAPNRSPRVPNQQQPE